MQFPSARIRLIFLFSFARKNSILSACGVYVFINTRSNLILIISYSHTSMETAFLLSEHSVRSDPSNNVNALFKRLGEEGCTHFLK